MPVCFFQARDGGVGEEWRGVVVVVGALALPAQALLSLGRKYHSSKGESPNKNVTSNICQESAQMRKLADIHGALNLGLKLSLSLSLNYFKDRMLDFLIYFPLLQSLGKP